MPVPMESPRWSFAIVMEEGWLLVDLLDAHAHGEHKIEFCHHHEGAGDGWLLVDL